MPSLKIPLLGTIIFAIITIAMYCAAIDVQQGGMQDFSGKHATIKKGIYSIGSSLGPTGSLVVGGIITLGMVVWLIITLRKRKQVQNTG